MRILVALLCAAVVLVRAHPLQVTPAAGLLALLALALLAAARSGFQSTAWGALLALALTAGPPAALLTLGAGLVLRLLRTGWRRWPEDLLPILAGLAAVAVAPPWLAAAAPQLVWIPLVLRLAPAGSLAQAALILASLVGPPLARNPLPGLFLVALQALVALDARRFQVRGQETERVLVQARDALDETEEERRQVETERALIKDLTVGVSQTGGQGQVLELLLEAVTARVSCQSVAVMRAEDDRLVPLAGRGPARLDDEALLRRGEPVVEEAWKSGMVTFGQGQRLFPGETFAVALPMQSEAVLYVGRPAPGGFRPDEVQLLWIVALAGGMGLQSSARFETQNRALEQYARAHARQKVWVERLAFLLEAARSLASGLSRPQILERFQQLLEVTLPHDQGVLLMGAELEPAASWPADPGDRLEGIRRLAAMVVRNQAPLLVDDPTDFPGSRLPFMASPILYENELLGVVYLAGLFSREQLDVLRLLCFQAGLALQNAAMHQEVATAQARVVQSSKLAAVGQLAAGVAHELNTPLCTAMMALDVARLCLECDQPDRADQKLEQAEAAGTRCQEIIGKLLYYARGSSQGRVEVDLSQVAAEVLSLLGQQLSLDGIELETDLPGELPRVRADANELQQVVTHLLLNARDAVLQEGAGARRVRLETRAGAGEVVLTLADQGPGMPSEVLERIFEPFYTTKPVGRGTGLGLSVSQEIVRRHQGTLLVESQPGQGTCCTLKLPCLSG